MEEGAEPGPSRPPAKHRREQEDEEEGALHVSKRRRELCSEFAAITSSNAAVASRFLAGSDWHIERVLNAYFDSPWDTMAASRVAPACADTGSCIDLTAQATTSNAGVSSEEEQKEDESNFSMITWNINGLDPRNWRKHAGIVCTYLTIYSPDVVFLQEVIPLHLPLFHRRADNYTIISDNIGDYFTIVMLKKSRVKLLKQEITAIPTAMKRNLLVVHVSICGIELCLMTSHLQSSENLSKEHIKQLQIVLDKMKNESESTTVIFGGDTRLRDSEVTELDLPNNIKNVWEFLGKPQHCHCTQDSQTNTNVNAICKCNMRFDHIYFRPAVEGGGDFIPQSMNLIGLKKLECGTFPNDHWGILCNFHVIL